MKSATERDRGPQTIRSIGLDVGPADLSWQRRAVQLIKRWGDYSNLTIDPKDDCTFWYTQEYYVSTGSFNWATRVGAFKFDTCKPAGK
jgi:hypothetical protein